MASSRFDWIRCCSLSHYHFCLMQTTHVPKDANRIFKVIECLFFFFFSSTRSYRSYTRLHSTSNDENQNQMKTFVFDIAECLDDQMKFEEGMHLLLARGSLGLNEEIARQVCFFDHRNYRRFSSFVLFQQLNTMNPFERILFFQELSHNTP